jgi:hypothetical protein
MQTGFKDIFMKRIKPGFLLVVMLLAAMMQVYAQSSADSTGPASTVLRFTCVSTSDDSIQLKSTISVKRDDGNTNLVNAPVIFYAVGTEGDIKIGEAKTTKSSYIPSKQCMTEMKNTKLRKANSL